jgi:hypothetical protein
MHGGSPRHVDLVQTRRSRAHADSRRARQATDDRVRQCHRGLPRTPHRCRRCLMVAWATDYNEAPLPARLQNAGRLFRCTQGARGRNIDRNPDRGWMKFSGIPLCLPVREISASKILCSAIPRKSNIPASNVRDVFTSHDKFDCFFLLNSKLS